MTKRTWHNGPPPFPGWWNASAYRDLLTWRWWDGRCWSMDVEQKTSIEYVVHFASRSAWTPKNEIEWTDYWPENARVPRIDPRSEK